MTLKIFEDELRTECKRLYSSLRDGSRNKKLKNKKINSLTDIFFLGRKNPRKLFQGCAITFGNVLENTLMNYAEKMGANVYREKSFLSLEIDGLFRIVDIVYNLESKANIELDKEKTREAFEALKRKHEIVFNGLECRNKRWQVISKIIVWTKETSEDAAKTAKKPLEEKHLMGFKDFFELFYVIVVKDDFFSMLQRVWIEEVEVFF